MALTEYKVPLKNLAIYNDIYGLGISSTDADVLAAYFDTFKESTLKYIHSSATNTKDFVLTFDNVEPVVRMLPKNEFVANIGYRAFITENSRYCLKFVPAKADLKFFDILGELDNSDARTFSFDTVDALRAHVLSTDMALVVNDYNKDLASVELLYWLVNTKKFDTKKYTKRRIYNDMPEYVQYIIDVLQLVDDTRIAIYAEHGSTSYNAAITDMFIRTYVVRPESQAYNWTDPDRYMSHIDDQTNLPKVFYSGANPLFPSERAITRYARGQLHVVLDDDTLSNIDRRDKRKAIEETAIAKAMTGLKKKIEDRVAELDKGKEFSYNDVTFRQNEIEYEGQILKAVDVTTKDVIAGFTSNLSDDSFNFEKIFEAFCNKVIGFVTPPPTPTVFRWAPKPTTPPPPPAPTPTTTSATIGAVTFKLERVDRVNTAGVKTVMYYIDGQRINREELLPVMMRAICYTKQGDFTKFLESVSSCSLRYHRVIASGILLKVTDELLDIDIEFKIGLEREGNRNYISFSNGNRYVVKDTNRLLSLERATDMTKVINVLVDPNIVGIQGREIREAIDNGKKALELETQKQNEMLATAVDMFKCQKLTDTLLDNGRSIKSGYVVKGKLREYLVEDTTLRVYEYPTGKYLCMVDKGQNEHANIPRLVSRMFALANDSKLANEISTLQKTQ